MNIILSTQFLKEIHVCLETVCHCKSTSEKAMEIILPMLLHEACIISWKSINNDLV